MGKGVVCNKGRIPKGRRIALEMMRRSAPAPNHYHKSPGVGKEGKKDYTSGRGHMSDTKHKDNRKLVQR